MSTDTLRTLALLATFLCTKALSSANPVQEGSLIFPIFRYAKYEGDELMSEYVGAPDGPFIDNFGNFPKPTDR